MTSPPPLVLAHKLAPLLTDLDWGIGGSLLLYNLKLVTDPQDLDIVTTPKDYSSSGWAVRAVPTLARHRRVRRAGPTRLPDFRA
jgi:hypothetical protein